MLCIYSSGEVGVQRARILVPLKLGSPTCVGRVKEALQEGIDRRACLAASVHGVKLVNVLIINANGKFVAAGSLLSHCLLQPDTLQYYPILIQRLAARIPLRSCLGKVSSSPGPLSYEW